MSDITDISNDFEPADNISEVGTTSQEMVRAEAPKRPWFNLFNAMLLISFILITLSSMLMIWHLFDRYGAPWDLPWNV